MQKKHIITIAGRPGSGKSTTSNLVAAKLGYQRFSSGDLFRAIGKEMGLHVLDANRHAEHYAEIDHKVDQRLQDMNENDDNKVIDSRMAWHWMPSSFKVYLELDTRVAAERILSNLDEDRAAAEHIPTSVDAYTEQLENRLASEAKRYKALYDVNPYDHSNYNLVVDTAKNSPEEAAELIVKEFQAWLQA